MKKYLTVIGVLLLVVACGKGEEIQPKLQDIKELVFASGTLEWDNAYNLTAQTDGIISEVNFEVGSKVVKGKSVAEINNEQNRINVQTTQEQLQIAAENVTDKAPALLQLTENIQFAESKHAQDNVQVERYRKLFESQSVSKLELENITLTAKNSLANLNALKKQYAQVLQAAKQQYITQKGQLRNNEAIQNYNHVYVAMSGTVIKKLKSNGDYVRKGDVIAVIADASKVEGLLNVDENSIDKIKLGQVVFVQLNTNKQKVFKGKVSEILSSFDAASQSFICKVLFDAPLATSYYGTQLEANILIGEKKNALLIPKSYLDYGNKVHLKSSDQLVKIRTGIVSSEYVEVLSGITKNDVLLPLIH